MSVETLNENVSTISESTESEVTEFVVELLGGDMDIIQALDDEPNDVGGLTAAELKAKFDEGGNIIKKYINETLVPAISDTVAEAKIRAAAEAERIANETVRTEAEQGRVEAEAARAEAEEARAAAENGRASAEAVRIAQEQARVEAEKKRQSADKLGAADRILSNITDPAQALSNIGAKSNDNLLRNWYFADPINQRGGYVVPPGVTFYNDTACTEVDIVNGVWRAATYINDEYGTVKTGENLQHTKYVKSSDMVRGYVGAGYGIDGWFLQQITNTSLLIADGYVTLNATNNDGLIQKFPAEQFKDGDIVTTSVLTADGELMTKTFTLSTTITKYAYNDIWSCAIGYISNSGTWNWYPIITYARSPQTINLEAVKLELGSVQTLAHQDEDGNWVLNDPPPNKALELAKCQRYQYKTKGSQLCCTNANGAYLDVFVPVHASMRSRPSVASFVVPTDTTNLLYLNGTAYTGEGLGLSVYTVYQNEPCIAVRLKPSVSLPAMQHGTLTQCEILLDANL